jgi:hypothetical protein
MHVGKVFFRYLEGTFPPVRFEVLTAVSTKMAVFSVAAPGRPHGPDDEGSKDL